MMSNIIHENDASRWVKIIRGIFIEGGTKVFEDVPERFATEENVAKEVICGPDKEKHLEAIHEMIETGYDQVYIHQVGPNQEGFLGFYQREILPEFTP